MSDAEIQARWDTVDRAARELGYEIHVDKALNMPSPITHMAFAHRGLRQPSMGAFLTYSVSEIEAAEAGLAVLRRIVQDGEPWPKG
jgi:hypothetical protein